MMQRTVPQFALPEPSDISSRPRALTYRIASVEEFLLGFCFFFLIGICFFNFDLGSCSSVKCCGRRNCRFTSSRMDYHDTALSSKYEQKKKS